MKSVGYLVVSVIMLRLAIQNMIGVQSHADMSSHVRARMHCACKKQQKCVEFFPALTTHVGIS